MSNIIRIKRGITGGVVPTGLTFGELAVNITDKKLFVGGLTGNTIEIVASGGGGAGVAGVSSFNGLTGALGITVAGNMTLSMTGADNKTFRLYVKPPPIVKGSAGTIAWTDTTVAFEGDGFDLGAASSFKYNFLGDLSVEMPGTLKIGTLYSDSYIRFADGTTQGSAAVCCPIPLATTGSTGVASFESDHFNLGSTGHVAIKTGIKAGNFIVLGTSAIFGAGATGALPALDGSALTGVDAALLRGKSPRQITDGGTF